MARAHQNIPEVPLNPTFFYVTASFMAACSDVIVVGFLSSSCEQKHTPATVKQHDLSQNVEGIFKV